MYLSFIETSEIYEQYPNAPNRKIAIEIVAKNHPNGQGKLFIEKVREALSSAGYYFDF